MREDAPAAALAVRVRALVKRYAAVLALDGIDLAVAGGEAFGLVGANGAGKTTLLRCLLDLAAPDAGTIEIFGCAAGNPAARRRLAYLPERFQPPHYLRGEEFLRAMLRLMGDRYDAAAALALCAELELEREALERPVRALSKGMTQKLGLAACFLARRDLYVLDEPMSGLDPAARVAVKSVLRRLAGEGRTLLFTSHVLADVEELCSSLAVLHRARLRFQGAPRALCARYGEAGLERAFMKCIRDEPADEPRVARG
ncbi:MAG TPA: ATP-binding cassette domain-containing protein [Burkholderiales bacterium]|nr:ATP-binding cassette domain-containing protein [Burkholderiales bacterium]